jgi:threonine dehydratase
MSDPVTYEDIVSARERGRTVVLETPLIPSNSFSKLADADVWLKAENLQRTGSFKIRGAMNALSLLPPETAPNGVVAASAGNHAQGVALAAAELGLTCTVFMPETAAIPKIAATKAYGAEVRLGGDNLAEAVDLATAFSEENGATFIHPYDDPDIVAGQGTFGIELGEQLPQVTTVIIPVGGGGLIGGSALALKQANPDVHIVGVQSAAVPTYIEARRTGTPSEIRAGHTIADGIACSRPSDLCYGLIETYVDDLVAVGDADITNAVALLLERGKLLVEPAGAVTVAALLGGAVDLAPGPVVATLSGGNVDLLVIDDVVRHGLEAQGRYAELRIVIVDEPGNLAAALTTVGETRGNVLSVGHHREGTGRTPGWVEISITLETRSNEHFGQIVSALEAQGVEVIQSGGSNGSPG